MKIVFSGISEIIDTDVDGINTIIVERQSQLFDICNDINNQILGYEGKTVISKDDKQLEISKNVELITQFVPFEINRKSLLSKLVSKAENIASEPDFYEYSMTELANLEKYLWQITECLDGNIIFSKLSINSIIKSVGIEFEEDYSCIGEKIIDYMDLVRTYDNDKLFIFVNLRSFINDDECFVLFDNILRKQFNVLMIDNSEHLSFSNERRLIIDKDYCEIK